MSELPTLHGFSPMAARAATLRDAFDRSFADPARPDPARQEDFLAIRIEGEAFALRLSEIAGLHADKKVVRVPGGVPALLGIAAFRGTILPVFSFAILLDHAARASPRWLAVATAAPVAFAFDAFEHHLRVSAETTHAREATTEARPFVRHFMPAQQRGRPILDLPSILNMLRRQRPAGGQERSDSDVQKLDGR
ncbi:MAG: chemotaxis protein CheW [Aliidongia sp.]